MTTKDQPHAQSPLLLLPANKHDNGCRKTYLPHKIWLYILKYNFINILAPLNISFYVSIIYLKNFRIYGRVFQKTHYGKRFILSRINFVPRKVFCNKQLPIDGAKFFQKLQHLKIILTFIHSDLLIQKSSIKIKLLIIFSWVFERISRTQSMALPSNLWLFLMLVTSIKKNSILKNRSQKGSLKVKIQIDFCSIVFLHQKST